MKKNLFKKLVTGVLATSLGVVALTGCGAEKTSDKGNQPDICCSQYGIRNFTWND